MNLQSSILNKILTYLLPLVVAGVMLNVFNVYIITIYLTIYFFTISRKETGISFAIILPPFFGSLFQIFNISIPGSFFSLIVALAFVFPYFKDLKTMQLLESLKFLVPVILICLSFFFFTGNTEKSTSKIIGLLITCCYTPFVVLLAKSKDISLTHFYPVFILYALLMIRVAYDFYNYSPPTGLFDFQSFRLGGYENVREDTAHVNYQNVGIAALFAMSFWLTSKSKLDEFIDYIVVFTAAWVILISGARQAIVGFIIVLGFWLIFRTGRIKISGFVTTCIIAYFAIMVLQSLNIEFINSLFDNDSTVRDYSYPMLIISNNPMLGIGFGNYWDPVKELYFAHNLILEILCEMGVVGLLFLTIPVIAFIRSQSFSMLNNFACGGKAFMIFLPFFIRSMISDDLSRNIMVFISFFVFFQLSNSYNQQN